MVSVLCETRVKKCVDPDFVDPETKVHDESSPALDCAFCYTLRANRSGLSKIFFTLPKLPLATTKTSHTTTKTTTATTTVTTKTSHHSYCPDRPCPNLGEATNIKHVRRGLVPQATVTG